MMVLSRRATVVIHTDAKLCFFFFFVLIVEDGACAMKSELQNLGIHQVEKFYLTRCS